LSRSFQQLACATLRRLAEEQLRIESAEVNLRIAGALDAFHLMMMIHITYAAEKLF